MKEPLETAATLTHRTTAHERTQHGRGCDMGCECVAARAAHHRCTQATSAV